ncbi:Bifunctional glutamine synthetase adenylyltransferase/adenylyl-removing enzyme, partial [Frankliniella fusca]
LTGKNRTNYRGNFWQCSACVRAFASVHVPLPLRTCIYSSRCLHQRSARLREAPSLGLGRDRQVQHKDTRHYRARGRAARRRSRRRGRAASGGGGLTETEFIIPAACLSSGRGRRGGVGRDYLLGGCCPFAWLGAKSAKDMRVHFRFCGPDPTPRVAVVASGNGTALSAIHSGFWEGPEGGGGRPSRAAAGRAPAPRDGPQMVRGRRVGVVVPCPTGRFLD